MKLPRWAKPWGWVSEGETSPSWLHGLAYRDYARWATSRSPFILCVWMPWNLPVRWAWIAYLYLLRGGTSGHGHSWPEQVELWKRLYERTQRELQQERDRARRGLHLH